MKTILLVALVISAILAITQALSCLPCDSEEIKCPPLYQLGCKGGLSRDVCGCCATCAKVKGEICGGPWNIEGVCDCGLWCFKSQIVIAEMSDFNAHGRCIPRREYGKRPNDEE